MAWDRREIYHLESEQDAAIYVDVKDAAERSCRGVVMDLTAEGVGVRFFSPDSPGLVIGEETEIRLSAAALKAQAATGAQVVHRENHGQRVEYGLRFLDKHYVQTQLLELKGLFNRRNAYRVNPPMSMPVKARLALEGGEQKVWVRNISITGMCFAAPPDLEKRGVPSTGLKLVVELPDGGDPFPLVVNVRYRRLADDHIIYGVEFETLRTDEYSKAQDRIATYVMKAQREQLARSRDR